MHTQRGVVGAHTQRSGGVQARHPPLVGLLNTQACSCGGLHALLGLQAALPSQQQRQLGGYSPQCSAWPPCMARPAGRSPQTARAARPAAAPARWQAGRYGGAAAGLEDIAALAAWRGEHGSRLAACGSVPVLAPLRPHAWQRHSPHSAPSPAQRPPRPALAAAHACRLPVRSAGRCPSWPAAWAG